MKDEEIFFESMKTVCNIKRNEPLEKYTTFHTGGPADYLIEPFSDSSFSEILLLLKQEGLPVTFIGGGSNLLVSDDGIRGAVVRISSEGEFSEKLVSLKNGLVYADARTGKRDFIDFCVENGFGGVEFMAGIPGTIGGGIMMNAGTNLGCFADILTAIDYISSDGIEEQLSVSADMYTYRNFSLSSGAVVTGGLFSLPVSDDTDGLKKRLSDINEERKSKHPLEYPSAGSVFKNPEGHSSWKLVDSAGLKGASVGGAMVSEKHTNFIINTGIATSKDIRDLIFLIQKRVYEYSGIKLETEIKMLGF